MPSLGSGELERYRRHIVLKEVGGPGQQRLKSAKVLLVGAGGLGGPAGLYLAAAGVGTIGLCDSDQVSLSNLQRQIQFATADLGADKTKAMATRLQGVNPHTHIAVHDMMITARNASSLVSGYGLVLDGTDNFESRFAINAACRAAGIALVSGAVGRWDGQVASFSGDETSPCYQCLVPAAPPSPARCAELGIVGALTGIIGAAMALEAIKIITGAGTPLIGRLALYDGLTGDMRTVNLGKDPACPVCAA